MQRQHGCVHVRKQKATGSNTYSTSSDLPTQLALFRAMNLCERKTLQFLWYQCILIHEYNYGGVVYVTYAFSSHGYLNKKIMCAKLFQQNENFTAIQTYNC